MTATEIVFPKAGAQHRALRTDLARLNVWEGAVRSGKTFTSILRFVEECATGPPGRFAMIGKTERTLKRNVVDELYSMLPRGAVDHNRGEGEIRIGTRRCYAYGANDERAETKLRGATLAGAYGDEITLWPESFFRMLLTRLSVPDARLIGTTNPDLPTHYLNRDFLKRADELGLVRLHFVLEDNPTLSDEYVESLKREFSPPGSVWYRRYILGEWTLAEGVIWQAFNDRQHVVSTLPEIVEWWIGVDYGTTNPFVALLIGLGVDDRLYVAREWRHDSRKAHKQLTDVEYSQQLRDWIEPTGITPSRWFVDPSAASFHVQMWRDGVLNVQNANNDVEQGLRLVGSLIANDRVRFHESCAGLLDEIPSYVWDDKAAERGVEQPVKKDDHGPDALRYALMGLRHVWRRWLYLGRGRTDDADTR